MTAQRLLILDDDVFIGQAMVGIAEFMSVEVRLSTDFDDFIRELVDWQPSHLMIDLIMPDKDGVEVLGELAGRGIDCQLILTSGAGEQLLQAAARSAAAHGLKVLGLLPKPFNPKQFRELMQLKVNIPETATLGGQLHQQRSPTATITPEDIDTALEQGDIQLAYQPKVTCSSGALSGFEALARWQHPEKGFIPPDVFIPIAEREGLIDRLTVQVFEQALSFLGRWQQNISSAWKLKLSVNISALSLTNEALFSEIERLCQQQQIAPEQLILELTETAAMDDPIKSLDMLTRLRMRGFRLSIDDFGTGFSSMLALVRMPFSEVKIDKSFVMTAANSRESRQVIKSTIDLAHSLEMTVTAEGIETLDSLQQLQDMGCDLAQGYFIGRPMPQEQLNDWLNEREHLLEAQRLQSIEALNLKDVLHEKRFVRLTWLARKLLNVDASYIALVDAEYQWIHAAQGDLPVRTNRSEAFCNLTIMQDQTLVLNNVDQDPRFLHSPLINKPPYIKFYAGCPIHAPSGEKLGTMSITHNLPREFSTTDNELLTTLAEMVDSEIAANPMLDADHLTGLLNQRGFKNRAETLLTLCNQRDHLLSMCYFDLDNFKKISGQQGQRAGDDALINFADLLRNAFAEEDLIARFGGDEFVVMSLSGSQEDCKAALQDLTVRLGDFNQQQNPSLRIAYSVGLASSADIRSMDLQSLYTLSDEDLRSRRGTPM
ncbi:MAG: EAL domain-containing protein [Methylophaga sp.]